MYKEEIQVQGKKTLVDAVDIDGQVIVANGGIISTAYFMHDWNEDVKDAQCLIERIKKSNLKADVFTFMQRLPESQPRFEHYYEWDNVAAIPLIDYNHWWEKQITQEARNKARKAIKNNVEVKIAEYDDEFVRGIASIYNESPVRQGKPFWHFGKDFEALKEMHATFMEKSTFLGAYHKNELIGFMKLVDAGRYTRTMHILSLIRERNKAPTNALFARAVELCCDRQIPYLVYGQYDYGNTGSKSLMDFKKYNGFKKIDLPRYYIPLNYKGKMIMNYNLHHGLIGILPKSLVQYMLKMRSNIYSNKYFKRLINTR